MMRDIETCFEFSEIILGRGIDVRVEVITAARDGDEFVERERRLVEELRGLPILLCQMIHLS